MPEREEMVKEAMTRMVTLRMLPEVIREFKKGNLEQSENGGFLYFASEQFGPIIKEFEKTFGGVVYHLIHDNTKAGEMLTLMYVSKYKEEWSQDREDLNNGLQLCYSINLSDKQLSEFGFCKVVPHIGGLVRQY